MKLGDLYEVKYFQLLINYVVIKIGLKFKINSRYK